MLTSTARKKPSIGLTPLIDVVFILLIFFMLVMQFQQFQQNSVVLKKSDRQGRQQPNTETVTVLPDSQCLYQAQVLTCHDVITTLKSLDNIQVLIAYDDATSLQMLMHWHDQFAEQFASVSLAVRFSEPLPEHEK